MLNICQKWNFLSWGLAILHVIFILLNKPAWILGMPDWLPNPCKNLPVVLLILFWVHFWSQFHLSFHFWDGCSPFWYSFRRMSAVILYKKSVLLVIHLQSVIYITYHTLVLVYFRILLTHSLNLLYTITDQVNIYKSW